jgi:hypothetical protein
MATNSKTSILVNSQLPQFVREDYETFVAFVRAYYEYLEQSNNTVAFGKVLERSKNLRDYLDVDKTLDDFSERLYSHFLKLIPKDAVADKNIIIKNVQDFYRARGTEKALKFLLRILIGQEAEIYYPKRDILRWSDGKWYIPKSLRVRALAIDGVTNTSYSALSAFRSTKITGNTSNASAVIEKVDRFVEGGTQVDELLLSGLKGTFSDGETIHATFFEAGTRRFITANVFPSFINQLNIVNPGLSYNVGDYLSFNPTNNANAYVSLVTTGNITSLLVVNGGAGFRANDVIIFSGGGGSGANAKVGAANTDESYHPNSYGNICATLIRDLAGTTMNTANYPNCNYAIVTSPNANTRMIDALRLFTIANVGPVFNAVIITSGTGYVTTPELGAFGNTKLAELGVLGRMRIVAGGTGYNRGDVIEFFNQNGGTGTGAKGNVTSNASNGMITAVRFVANGVGVPIGGWGYEQNRLPRVNVRSSTGTGANIVLEAILTEGDSYQVGSGSFGAIQEITLVTRGEGFIDVPTITVAGGDGNAQVSCEILRGVFTYPGRYLNDDGQLSSYNFLQDRHYYQNYSYVVRVRESLAVYRKALLDINHPAGLKLFGEYTHDSGSVSLGVTSSDSVERSNIYTGVFSEGGAEDLLTGESDGLAFDFTYDADRDLQALVLDTTTPANDFSGDPFDLLTYTSPSLKLCRQSDGIYRYGNHNLCPQSQTVDGTGNWPTDQTTLTSNNTTAPDGSVTADLVTATGSGNQVQGNNDLLLGQGNRSQISVYLKYVDTQWVRVGCWASGFGSAATAYFDIQNGATGSSGGSGNFTILGTSISAVANGFYKCTIDFIAGTDNVRPWFRLSTADGGGGAGSGSYYIWGIQVKRTPVNDAGGYTLTTGYIATTSAAKYDLPYEWDADGNPLGILIEEVRTNLYTRSQEFNHGDWGVSEFTVATNNTTAPDGTTTAERITCTNTTGVHHVHQQQSVTNGTSYTQSIFVKPGTGRYFSVGIGSGISARGGCTFDLQTGTISNTQNTAVTATGTISDAGNGWFRVSVSLAVNSTGSWYGMFSSSGVSNPTLDIFGRDDTHAAAGTETYYIWGAQFEAGAFPTSPIHTIAATVTRALDRLYVLTTLFPYSSAYWSVVIAAQLYTLSTGSTGAKMFWNLGNSVDGANGTELYQDASGNPIMQSVAAGVTTVQSDLGLLTVGTHKIAVAAAANDFAGCVNGGLVTTDTSATMPASAPQFFLGTDAGPDNGPNFYLRQITYLPRRVTNAELQALTS